MDMPKEKDMPLSGHLKELRNRIAVCVVCLVVVFLAALSMAPGIIDFLMNMGEQYDYVFVYLSPQELLMQHFSVAMIASVCVTLPMMIYQIWAFVRPGLRKNENRLFRLALIFGLLCFALGIVFAYKIMIPFTLRFLINIGNDSGIAASISIQNYISFLMTLFLVFGVVFELPVLSVLLTQMGLLKISWMKKGRKIMVVLIFLIAAIVTPPDVISQILVGVPMLVLYEFSIHISAFLLKGRKEKQEEQETDSENE